MKGLRPVHSHCSAGSLITLIITCQMLWEGNFLHTNGNYDATLRPGIAYDSRSEFHSAVAID